MLPDVVNASISSSAAPEQIKMNGVRIYTAPVTPTSTPGDSVFYSRRGDGPYYRWLFEKEAGRWRVQRVIQADFTRQSLSLATWKTVPVALQTRLGEHYLE